MRFLRPGSLFRPKSAPSTEFFRKFDNLWQASISTYRSANASAPTATSTRALTCGAWTTCWRRCTASWKRGAATWAANRSAPAISAAAPRRCSHPGKSAACLPARPTSTTARPWRKRPLKPIRTTSTGPIWKRCARRASTAFPSASSRSTMPACG